MKNIFLFFLSFLVLNAQQQENSYQGEEHLQQQSSFIEEKTSFTKKKKDSHTYDFFDIGRNFASVGYSKSDYFNEEGEKIYTLEGEFYSFNNNFLTDDKGFFLDFLGFYSKGTDSIFSIDLTIYGIILGQKISENFIIFLQYLRTEIDISNSVSSEGENIAMGLYFKHEISRDFYLQAQVNFGESIGSDSDEISKHYTIGLIKRNIYLYLRKDNSEGIEDEYSVGVDVFMDRKIKLHVLLNEYTQDNGTKIKSLTGALSFYF